LKNLRPIRALFPSWKFFDRLGEVPVLEFQVTSHAAPDDNALEWKPLPAAGPRPLSALIFNPSGNRNFALQTLISQWVDDIQELPSSSIEAIEAALSFQLICNWIRKEITGGAPQSSVAQTKFRFRLLAVGADQSRELFFQSSWLPATEQG
jgi:hypothetical protein